MTPIDAKKRYPRNEWSALILQAMLVTPPKAMCIHCNRYVDEKMSWKCGHCLTIVSSERFTKDGCNTLELQVHSVFGKCPNCKQEPPAVVCQHCGRLNPLSKASEEAMQTHAAVPQEMLPEALEQQQRERDEKEQQERIKRARRLRELGEAEGELEQHGLRFSTSGKRAQAEDAVADVDLHDAKRRRDEKLNPPPGPTEEERIEAEYRRKFEGEAGQLIAREKVLLKLQAGYQAQGDARAAAACEQDLRAVRAEKAKRGL